MTFTIPRPEWVSDSLIAERGEHAGFQMYSREGNDAVATMLLVVLPLAERLGAHRPAVIDALRNGIREVTKTHPEVWDTEPEWAIVDAVNAFFDTQGWVHISRDDLS